MPVFDQQAANTRELARIVGDENETTREGLTSNQNVIRSDGCAGSLQNSADFAGGSRVLLVERDCVDLQLVETRNVVDGTPTLEGSEIKLVKDNRTSHDIARFTPAQFLGWLRSPVVENSDQRVGIEQIPHSGNSLSSSGRSCSGGRSRAASIISGSSGPEIASSQDQSFGTGSKMTAEPCRRMRTSSPSKRYSFGSRTA